MNKLEAGKFYHIFNSAVGNGNLFYTEKNYIYFLKKLKYHLAEYIDLYAYCLMPNHFHLAIKIKEEERSGSLFKNRFKRVLVDDEIYLKKLIHYVHFNPVKHGFGSEIEEWKFSSYKELLSDQQTWLERERVIELFEDKENFKYCHLVEPDISGLE